MMRVVGIIVLCVFIGVIGLLCLFSCILASKKDEIWERIKFKKGGK